MKSYLFRYILFALIGSTCAATTTGNDVVLVKIGGSSITKKAKRETLDEESLEWFVRALSDIKSKHGTNTNIIVVHGAGSFGHHHAKEYGLRGQLEPPSPGKELRNETEYQHILQGMCKTRLSVQKLNLMVVEALNQQNVPAITMSPCFVLAGVEAYGGDPHDMLAAIKRALDGGLVPVLHGDACLYGEDGAGILSGDTIMEMIGKSSMVSRVVFITDVDGVYTKDPRSDPAATLLRTIEVDTVGNLVATAQLEATGSGHEHDVTGGLKTKLASAAAIASTGKDVTIVKCGSVNAQRALSGEVLDESMDHLATTLQKTK